MTIECDVAPAANVICVSRSIPEQELNAGCLLYSFGSVPEADTVVDNAILRAVNCAAGSLTQTINQAMQNEHSNDLTIVAQNIAQTLRAISKNLWDFSRCTGQGVYIGGVIVYFAGCNYFAIPFGGAALLSFQGRELSRLDPPAENNIIHDALGIRNGWAGRILQGSLAPGSILLGTTGTPADWQQCQQQIYEQTTSDIQSISAAMILRQQIAVASTDAAVIEFRL